MYLHAAWILMLTGCLAAPPKAPVVPDANSPAKARHLLKQQENPARVHKGKAKKPKVTKLPPKVSKQGPVTITHLTPAEGRKERIRIKQARHARKMKKLNKKYPGREYHEIPVEELADAYDMPIELAQCSVEIARAMTKENCEEIKKNRKRGRRFSRSYQRKVKKYSTDEYLAADSQDLAEVYGVPVEAVEAIKKTMRVRRDLGDWRHKKREP